MKIADYVNLLIGRLEREAYNRLPQWQEVSIWPRLSSSQSLSKNRPGAVAEIAKALGNAKVNILALLGTAQGNERYDSTGRRGCQASKEGAG